MKNIMYVFAIVILGFAIRAHAMEEDLNQSVLKEAIEQRKQAKNRQKKENFGDEEHTVVAAPTSDVSIDIWQLGQKGSEKKKKEKKKRKKDIVNDSLALLEEGINPEEELNELVAKLKLYKNNLSSEEEAVVRDHLIDIRESAPETYNKLQQQILGDATQATRGIFSTSAGTEQENALRQLVVKQSALHQLYVDALQKDNTLKLEALKLDAESNKTQLKQVELHEKQIEEMKQTNKNMVTSSQTNRRIGYASLAIAFAGLVVAIGGYFN